MNPDVLIVGAGPTGLALAYDLARRGNKNIRIIDKKPTTSEHSKAFGVHARTQEILDIMGMGDDFQKAGELKPKVVFHFGEKHQRALNLDLIDSPHNNIMSLPQSESESILHKNLQKYLQVEWNTELVGCENEEYILLKNGVEERVKPKWIVGCDGAHSFLRQSNNIPFTGDKFDQVFFMEDVTGECIHDPKFFHILFRKASEPTVMLFPFAGGRVRVITLAGDVYNGFKNKEVHWKSNFVINSRHVAKLHFKNIFLCGDAAHVHSPVGGQGMNTSIQDGFNLSWKLDLVLKGAAPVSILDAFEAERMPVIKRLVKMTRTMTLGAYFAPVPIKYIIRKIARFMFKRKKVNLAIATTMAQLLINYRNSPIVYDQNPKAPGPKAGDRLPDAELHDGKRVFSLLRNTTKHTLFLLQENAQIASFVKEKYGQLIDVRVICGDLMKLKYHAEPDSIYLIRPDGYIGYRALHADLNDLKRYLGSLFTTV